MSTPIYKNTSAIITAIIVVVALVSVSWFYLVKNQETTTTALVNTDVQTTTAPVAEAPLLIERDTSTTHDTELTENGDTTPTTPAKEPVAPVVLPTLSESDSAFVRDAQGLASSFMIWLTPEQQIRKWVILIDNLADLKVPAQDLPLDFPMSKFKVDTSVDEQIYFNLNNIQRAQPLIDAVTAVSPSQLVFFYHQWYPLFEQAYKELGRDDDFNTRVLEAIDNVLNVIPLNQPNELKQPSVFYIYSDKTLEEADKLSKFMWRLGPLNTVKIQDYLHEVKTQL